MNELELRIEVSKYRELFKTYGLLLGYRRKLNMNDDRMATALCEFYGIWSARKILLSIGFLRNFDSPAIGESDEVRVGVGESLPSPQAVQSAAEVVFATEGSREDAAILSALKEMGVFALCPMPAEAFPRMEQVALRVNGEARQVFLVDLALFAVEVGDYERAGQYISEANTFHPSSRELYNLCLLEGLVSLNKGRTADAVQCLERAISACQADVDSSIQCSLLPPNLKLAEELLRLGERMAVLRHLFECHNVWLPRRHEIEEWTHVIEKGEIPDLHGSMIFGEAYQPSYRLNIQWMRVCSIEMGLRAAKPRRPMSPAQVLMERERLMAEHARRMDSHIKKKLEYLE